MAGALINTPLGAIGSAGMNTQQSNIDLPPQFGLLALNCYADDAGRPTARKSMALQSSANVDLGTSHIYRGFRHNKSDGSSVMIMAGPDLLYRSSNGVTVTTLSGGTYTGYAWQFASLNGKVFAVLSGTTGSYFDESTWARTNLTTPGSVTFAGIHSAYGRLWAITGTTLYWSDLLDGTNFSTGASGSMDLQKLHTQFRDTAIAVTSFNRQIVVLCRNSIFVLGLADDLNPNNTLLPIYLRDFVPNVGCAARDTVVSTGDDVLFISDDGVRSLSRSMSVQQGPAPLTDVSQLNKNYTVTNLVLGNSTLNLTATWHPKKAWYMVFAAATNEVWVFDFGQRVPGTQLPRLFIWRMGATKFPRCGLYFSDGLMWYGSKSGMYTMESFDVTDAYTMSVTTGWLSLGGPERIDMYKRAMVNLSGGSGQTALLKWAVDFDDNTERSVGFTLDSSSVVYEYNVDEYTVAEYGSGAATAEVYMNLGGAGKVIKFTLEIPVQGYAVTLNNMLVFTKQGRIR